MRWAEIDRGDMRLLAWCFAALFLFAQTQAFAHAHFDEEDDGLTPECAVCLVASHLDDVDTTKVQPTVDIVEHGSPTLTPTRQPAQQSLRQSIKK